ncbi:DEAD/DEAH box helicase [Rickettsiaceae bacterium]|nr:DEAD/DEAH box helicase [Rickettsiaceae bacterium]
MKNFNEIGLPEALVHRLEHIGFTTPTPVQAESIPHALEGKDVLGSAQTGTGKTGAFGIPLVNHLLTTTKGTSLVLLPTRELALQVMKALQQFIGKSKIATSLLIGGEDMRGQFRQLKANPRLIVGTPGRINDHLNRGTLKLGNTDFMVLDEVDRMLDMGFGIQLDEIAKHLKSVKRQTLMFSATLPTNIQKLSNKYLTDPVRISVGSTTAPATKIKQENVKVSDSEKYPRLLDEINSRKGSIIVFIKTKHGADALAKKLRKEGHKADALHGDLRQNKRTRVIESYRKQNFRVLIATDVAARGLDIPHIAHVINHDLPQCPEDYIHRIGRTARAGAEGEALNFLSPSDGAKWRAIQRLINPGAKVEDLGGGRKKSNKRKGGGGGRRSGGGFKGGAKNNNYKSADGQNRKSTGWQRKKKSAA